MHFLSVVDKFQTFFSVADEDIAVDTIRRSVFSARYYRFSTPSYYPLAVGHATFSVDYVRWSPSEFIFEEYKVQCLRRATVQQLSNVEPYSRLSLTLIRNGHRPKSRSSSG